MTLAGITLMLTWPGVVLTGVLVMLCADFKVIAFLLAVFSFLGFADAWIYHRAGKPIAKHAAAGVSRAIVTLFAPLSLNTGVTA